MAKSFRVTTVGKAYSEWIFPTKTHRMTCCDCGLVHDMQFKAIEAKRLRGKAKKAGVSHLVRDVPHLDVMFRARRNERSTAAARRERKKAAKK